MKIKAFYFLLLISFGCTKNKPRRPIDSKPSTTLLYETVKESKALNELEVEKIEAYIAKDSVNFYETSKSGFWYTYQHKIKENRPTPKVGEQITFTYNITDLEGAVIYSKETLGAKTYTIDKEDFITALQKGVKLMKVGEIVTFIIPSYHAFGISGDGNKIGINKTIKSTVTLIN